LFLNKNKESAPFPDKILQGLFCFKTSRSFMWSFVGGNEDFVGQNGVFVGRNEDFVGHFVVFIGKVTIGSNLMYIHSHSINAQHKSELCHL
jgi:hypothetical protein